MQSNIPFSFNIKLGECGNTSAVQEPGYLDNIYLDYIHLDFIYLDNI